MFWRLAVSRIFGGIDFGGGGNTPKCGGKYSAVTTTNGGIRSILSNSGNFQAVSDFLFFGINETVCRTKQAWCSGQVGVHLSCNTRSYSARVPCAKNKGERIFRNASRKRKDRKGKTSQEKRKTGRQRRKDGKMNHKERKTHKNDQIRSRTQNSSAVSATCSGLRHLLAVAEDFLP